FKSISYTRKAGVLRDDPDPPDLGSGLLSILGTLDFDRGFEGHRVFVTQRSLPSFGTTSHVVLPQEQDWRPEFPRYQRFEQLPAAGGAWYDVYREYRADCDFHGRPHAQNRLATDAFGIVTPASRVLQRASLRKEDSRLDGRIAGQAG